MISFPLPLQLNLVKNVCNYPGTGDLVTHVVPQPKDLVGLACVDLGAGVALGAGLPCFMSFFELLQLTKHLKVAVKLQGEEE